MNGTSDERLRALLTRAASCDTRAMLKLGDMYREGDGVEQNYQQTLSWFQQAVDHSDAMGRLGICSSKPAVLSRTTDRPPSGIRRQRKAYKAGQ